MKIEIIAGGIYDANGEELPIGSTHELKDEPTGWAGRYRVVGGKTEGKTLVTGETENADAPKGPFVAGDLGGGWWAITDADGKEVGKKLRKDDAEAFNGLSDEDKLAYVTAES